MSLLSSIRQFLYPREFRIPEIPWPAELEELLTQFREILNKLEELSRKQEDTNLELWSYIGTGLWRLRQRMIDPATGKPFPAMRSAFRHLEAIWDILVQTGIDIIDHTDMPFDAGLLLKVIAYQPIPGLTREKIIETIKPTIYYKGKLIQIGEVIVGRPE